MKMESRGGNSTQKGPDELRAQTNLKQTIGQNCISQAAHVQQLQEKLSEVQQQLEKETRRSQLLEQELAHLRALTLQNTKHQASSSSATVAQQSPRGQQQKQAAEYQPDHELHPQEFPRAHSVDGEPSPSEASEVHRAQSAPSGPGIPAPKQSSMGKAVRSALHAVSGAYLKEQAKQQSASLEKRRQPMSEAESKAHRFIEKAQPVLLGEASDRVTISKQAFELLVLKDRAINAVKEGITIADCSLPDHPLIFANDAFSKITGYSREEVLGKNCRFLQGPGTEDEEIQKMRDAAAEGRPSVVQLLNYKKNGDPFINYLSITPIHDSKGHVTHFVGIQSDISDLVNHKKAELAAKSEAAQAAAATEVKSQFLARMSHEIRTPLNGMIAVGQLLAETTLSPAQWDLMNTIRCSGETLLTLITDILDFSRIEADKMVLSPTEFHLQTVIEAAMEIAGLHAAQKRLQVAYNVADNVPKLVTCDAQRLQQVLLNVLNNAVKFTEKGEVLLEVWCEPHSNSNSNSNSNQASQQAQRGTADNPPLNSEHASGAHAEQPLLGQISENTGQLVDVVSSRLEPFRPLTPDNLSQHLEFSEMRQQIQGPQIRQAAGVSVDTKALAASFNACGQGRSCSCSPSYKKSTGAAGSCVMDTSPDQHQSQSGLVQQGDLSSTDELQQQQQQQPQPQPQLQPQSPNSVLKPDQRRLQSPNSVLKPDQRRVSSDIFAIAAPASTREGQQRILQTSAASASPRAAAEPAAEAATHAEPSPQVDPQAQAGTDNEANAVPAHAALERASSESHQRQAIEGRDARRSNSASTSGWSFDDSAHYILNFSVRDSGIGISDESLKSLFQCFCQVDASPTRRFGGSGLGLAICKKLTEAMGGHMWVESDGLGQGSVFRWTLQAKGHNCMMPRSSSGDKSGSSGRSGIEYFSSSSGTSTRTSTTSSKSSGPRALRHHCSSTEWPAAASQAGCTVESGLALFSGKKVLLVEVCDMVRQVLTLALRRWGFQVCAVKNEADAITKLSLRDGHSDFLAACMRRAEGKLSLEHSSTDVTEAHFCDADGPYDVVILDMALSQLVLALMQGVEAEASTLVFLGWPGQNEPEEDALNDPMDINGPALASPMHSQSSACYQDSLTGLNLGSGAISAQMSQDTADKMSNGPIGSKQLMYAIVTRPVRQGRLKLALEEVLTTQPDPTDPATLQSPHDHAVSFTTPNGDSAPFTAAIAAPTSAPAQAVSNLYSQTGDAQANARHPGPSPAALRASQDGPLELPSLRSRRNSQLSSGRLSNASSTSGPGLPSPTELAGKTSSPSPSHGTEFEFALQSRRHSLHRAPKLRGHGSYSELAEVEGSRRHLKVLLAEDNLINMKVALGILKRSGYSEVTTVVDGQQAMDELHRRGGADAFDIILTDLHMPHKGGMEMVTEIRQLWPYSKVRVVAVTADAFEDRRDQCLASGFDGWLAKPFRVEDLVKIMEAVS